MSDSIAAAACGTQGTGTTRTERTEKAERVAREAVAGIPQVPAAGPLLGDLDLHLFMEGRHRELGSCLGAQPMRIGAVEGVRFAVWAPNARRVSVVGDFNGWDGGRDPMRLRQGAGIWELFIPGVKPGALYRYAIVAEDGASLPLKSDPMARAAEAPPGTASVVAAAEPFPWTDGHWMQQRARLTRDAWRAEPISIYEVHAASWGRGPDTGAAQGAARKADRSPRGEATEGGRADGSAEEVAEGVAEGVAEAAPDWRTLADRLIPYVAGLGFTHIELLPVMEHPFGGSWGYQPLGLFSPTARMGSPEAFAAFVDRCHAAGLGVILDWVPAHFPSDAHGMARFDGTALYEHGDPREGFHPDWNTLIYDFGRSEVRGFLIASALEWLERFHVDGLRVDAVSSMLYRDYSRKPGEWIPNVNGGRENLESIAFLRELNQAAQERCPGALIIAEESTAWPGVSAPEQAGGLGFSFKWNMGWMHDTLRYLQCDPIYRRYHHHDLTFAIRYAFSERFVLAVSHDEVVHGKGSLWQKMPGSPADKLANLRAFLGFMWTHPGKKLLFMGCEFAQMKEWNHDASLQWELPEGNPAHRGVQRLVRDLNRLYREERSLHGSDCDAAGFEWLVADDAENSVAAFLRRAGEPGASPLLVVCNFTPVARHGYRVGVPCVAAQARWREVLNTDSALYGGTNQGNLGAAVARQQPLHGQPASLCLTLPPLSTILFRLEN